MSSEYWKEKIDQLNVTICSGNLPRFLEWHRLNIGPGNHPDHFILYIINEFLDEFKDYLINSVNSVEIDDEIIKYLFANLQNGAKTYTYIDGSKFTPFSLILKMFAHFPHEMNDRITLIIDEVILSELKIHETDFNEVILENNLDEIDTPIKYYVESNLQSELTLPNNPEMKIPLDSDEIREMIIHLFSREYVNNCLKIFLKFGRGIPFSNFFSKWKLYSGIFIMDKHSEFLEDLQRLLMNEEISPIDEADLVKYKSVYLKMEALSFLSNNFIVSMKPIQTNCYGMSGLIEAMMIHLETVLTEPEMHRLIEIQNIFSEHQNRHEISISKTVESNYLLCKVTGCSNAEFLERLINEVRYLIDVAIYLYRTQNVTNPILK